MNYSLLRVGTLCHFSRLWARTAVYQPCIHPNLHPIPSTPLLHYPCHKKTKKIIEGGWKKTYSASLLLRNAVHDSRHVLSTSPPCLLICFPSVHLIPWTQTKPRGEIGKGNIPHISHVAALHIFVFFPLPDNGKFFRPTSSLRNLVRLFVLNIFDSTRYVRKE
jgi:hypothetical protein